ncbi:MAG: DUF58 domain-containing protein [Acidobacteria bacterium]|nr:DUF58 domain-containing protein [Acidobacteriota bacterium]MCW5967670.1 DUF58 domain-containing protein [Blastocatellales bacterium]
MIFTRRFYLLLALGVPALVLLWSWAPSRWIVAAWNLAVLAAAVIDWKRMESAQDLGIVRRLPRRLMINAENEVEILVGHRPKRRFILTIMDEFPPELELRGRRILEVAPQKAGASASYRLFAGTRGDFHFGDIVVRWPGRWGLAIRQARVCASTEVKVYPNIHDAKKHELFAQRNRQLITGLRRSRVRGQGKEFESLREYVRGDELRHVSWTATARRGRLMSKQYQIERNQNLVLMIDAGRLMTSRIGEFSKLDHAIQAALAMGYVALHGGDNIGLLVFAREVLAFLPPQRGQAQMRKMLDSLYNIKPRMIEPSYARAFESLSRHCKRRSLLVILTDLVDADASSELLAHTATLLPRHLPLIVAIGDNDLRSMATAIPREVGEVYRQSVAEEMLRQREEALARITELGGLALDAPAGELSIQLINKYLEVKARGLL